MRKGAPLVWYPPFAAVLFGLSVFATTLMLEVPDRTAAARLALTLLPVAGGAYFIASESRWLRQYCDELQRRLHLEAFVASLAVTFLALLFVQFMHRAQFPVWSYDHVWPFAYIGGYLAGYGLARRRYRYE